MSNRLSTEQTEAFQRDGILFPFPVLSEDQAAEALRKFEELEHQQGGKIDSRSAVNLKPHLLLPWLNALIRHPAVLDAVEGILGPDILCWGSNFFAKKAKDGQFISWHQDSTYFELSSSNVVTAWVAFTPSTPASGCLQVVPGTHKQQVKHMDTYREGNMLPRGQEVAVEVDREKIVDVVLKPGEMSLHHVMLFHGSEANVSTHRRVGYAIRYIPTSIKQNGEKTTATLVRGEDRYGHFDLETSPGSEFHPDAVAMHAEASRRLNLLRFRGVKQ
jgi:non-haem Fe2+, alpha-ketoglutarate-dependent halogenase